MRWKPHEKTQQISAFFLCCHYFIVIVVIGTIYMSEWVSEWVPIVGLVFSLLMKQALKHTIEVEMVNVVWFLKGVLSLIFRQHMRVFLFYNYYCLGFLVIDSLIGAPSSKKYRIKYCMEWMGRVKIDTFRPRSCKCWTLS